MESPHHNSGKAPEPVGAYPHAAWATCSFSPV